MKRLPPATVFFAWLYGVPFLFIVGLVRRTSSPDLTTHASASQFARITDAVLTAGLVLNLVLPLAGVLLSSLLGQRYWTRHFGWSLVGMVSYYVVVGAVAGAATAPLIGSVPADREPAPRVTQCIAISGGHGCPGG